MRGGWWAGLLLLASCGLETVPSLPAPDVVYTDALNTSSTLGFVHQDARYSGTDFRGYYVYYKVYSSAVDTTAAVARLLNDNSSVANSPTYSKLVSLGYRRMMASSSGQGNSNGVGDLLIEPSDGDTVKLLFENFLNKEIDATWGIVVQPQITFNDVPAVTSNLYRSQLLVGTANQTFDSLRTATTSSEDMEKLVSPADYEINFFIIAYGVTNTLTEVYSSPVPWGVIGQVEP